MKSRSGFVSNSSTSSFIILIKKDAYDTAYDKSDEFTQKVLDVVFGEKSDSCGSVFGVPCEQTEYSEGNWDTFYEDFGPDVEVGEEDIPEKYLEKNNRYYRGNVKTDAVRNAYDQFMESLNGTDVETFSVED